MISHTITKDGTTYEFLENGEIRAIYHSEDSNFGIGVTIGE